MERETKWDEIFESEVSGPQSWDSCDRCDIWDTPQRLPVPTLSHRPHVSPVSHPDRDTSQRLKP